MGDTRITLRINDVELDEINDFLARHPEYHNRSQLIRQAVMEYIRDVERGERGTRRNRGIRVEMEDRLLTILEEYVEFRYFRSMDELLSFVIKTIALNGTLGEILRGYVESLNGLRLDVEVRGREERFGRR